MDHMVLHIIQLGSIRGFGGGVTPIGGLVYMCLPELWGSLRYFARFMGHVL